MPSIESLHLLIAFFGGLGALFAGLGTFLGALAKLRSLKRGQEEGEDMKAKTKKYWQIATLGVAAALGGLALSLWTSAAEDLPLNVELTKASWDALNDEKFQVALAKTAKCIEEFEGLALIEQEDLEKRGEPLPPEGRVSEEQAEAIHARGLLNDVATCYFIRGRAYDSTDRIAEARKAYQGAAKFTYSRAWDPKGWFWSPAKAASGRLRTLED